jgi:hypothetical protein
MLDATRGRSGCEAVFAVLRVLMTGYVLWGPSGGIERRRLAETVGASGAELEAALDYLVTDGLAELDGERCLVRLSRLGARRLLVTGPRRNGAPCAVEFRARAWH